MPLPGQPRIYHITHVDNLARILADGGLHSDRTIAEAGGPSVTIGMSTIKQRRLTLPVKCYEGDFVGDYVPFYFCPRSVMLYLIYRGNHPELTYHGGQGPIVHLEADLEEVVAWANAEHRRWAFALSNAGAYYTEFRSTLTDLKDINWAAVQAVDWQASDIKEGKQAEFLIHEWFPITLVRRVGVASSPIKERVLQAFKGAVAPSIVIKPDWYY
jgi:ssDNA thymidine ADP-ribosyltransferase DarT-like protein